MIRFDTVAANADVIGEDTPMAEPGRSPGEARPDAAGRDRPERDGASGSGAGKAGQDVNAPGFIKEQDAGKPT